MTTLTVAPTKLNLWKVALLAFAAMSIQDIFATVMVVEEARFNAPIAGAFDALSWIASLICSALAIEEIVKNGWRTKKSLVIISAVSLANFVGTIAGVATAAALTHH